MKANLSDPWISALGAAKQIGCSRLTIFRACATGEITSREFAGRTLVLRVDLENFVFVRGRRRDSVAAQLAVAR